MFGPTIIVIVVVSTILPIALILFFFKGMAGTARTEQRLLATGLPGQARVLGMQHGGMTVTIGAHRHISLLLSLEVHLPGRPPYVAQCQKTISELMIASLQPGAWLAVRIDPGNPMNLAIAGPGSPPAATPGGPAPFGAGGMSGAAPAAGAFGAPPPAAGFGGVPPMPGGFGQPAAPMGMAPMAGFGSPAMGGALHKGMRRAIVITLLTTIPIAIVMLVVFVDFSGWFGGSDAPKGGYCKALVRCCKKVHGDAGNCGQYENLPAAGCKTAYETYKESAKAMGKTCK
jgi:hypothetical protein